MISSIQSGGINIIDTAINYRYQKAERSIGRALHQQMSEKKITRSEIFISTKNGYIPGDADVNLHPQTFATGLVKKKVIDSKDLVDGIHCLSPAFLEDQLRCKLLSLA